MADEYELKLYEYERGVPIGGAARITSVFLLILSNKYMSKTLTTLIYTTGLCMLCSMPIFAGCKPKQAGTKGAHETPTGTKETLQLPAIFENGLIYLKLPTRSGDTLEGLAAPTESACMIAAWVVDGLQLSNKVETMYINGSHTNIKKLIPMIRIVDAQHNASLLPSAWITDTAGLMKELAETRRNRLVLGSDVFIHNNWTFDYKNKQVWINTPINPADSNKPNVIKMRRPHGTMVNNPNRMTSIMVTADGISLHMLLDISAHSVCNISPEKEDEHYLTAMGVSVISGKIFDQWHKRHPEWIYRANIGSGEEGIEVPKIKIGNMEVGPVLFVKRHNDEWLRDVRFFTGDDAVEGAIGGSALQYMKVTIDYWYDLMKVE